MAEEIADNPGQHSGIYAGNYLDTVVTQHLPGVFWETSRFHRATDVLR
jgi:hypothetical protein